MIVTYLSPFGQSMIGKEVDDNFVLEIEGKEDLQIQSIEGDPFNQNQSLNGSIFKHVF